MKKLVIDIFNQYIDFSSDDYKETNHHIYENLFNINVEFENIKRDICNLITKDKGDGFNIIIQKMENTIYMKIFFILNEPSSQYEINYLTNYLETRLSISKDEINNDNLDKYENLIRIRLSETAEGNDLDEVLSIFNEAGIEYKIYIEEENIYEHGASSDFVEFIVAISGGLGTLVIQNIINKIKEDKKQKDFVSNYIIYGSFNKNKLLLNLAKEINDPNLKKYHISKFSKKDGENYTVTIESKDARYDLLCNKEARILNCKTTITY